jgi:hypothetical protein
MELLQTMETQAQSVLQQYFAEQLDRRTLNSPRGMGDAIEAVLAEGLREPLKDLTRNFEGDFARRAFADLAFEDLQGRYFVFDVKTHNLDTKFNMPNLTSVERLARFYKEEVEQHFFCLVHVA